MDLADFLIMDESGTEIPADASGNHVAFGCFACGHPVLATALPDQRGGEDERPAKCPGCGRSYFLDVRSPAQKIYIHTID